MLRRLPVLPTLLVLAAAATMVWLGLWQFDRLHEKEALLARYRSAQALTSEAAWPRNAAETAQNLYRHTTLNCRKVGAISAIAGQSNSGEPGQAHIAQCALADGSEARIVLGWSRNPAPVGWSGGQASGVIAPGPRLIADPPLAGLSANARPDPADLPNNHLAYAVQWFLFAGVALVIYALALRKRLAASAPRG